MKAFIEKSKLKGTVEAPPSKSMAHRMLICAGLSGEKSIVHHVSFSEDVLATLDCLSGIGVEYTIQGNTILFNGFCGSDKKGQHILKCRESGSTLRFFIPICSALGMDTVFEGSEKLLSRPLGVYEELFEKQGILFHNNGKNVTLSGKLSGEEYRIKGDISSQFISGLLFALPLLEEDSTLVLLPPVESRSYINLTLSALKTFGVQVEWKDDTTLFIPGAQKYRGKETVVEGDYSNAAFFEALNMIGNEVSVQGLNEESLQGDRVYREYFPMLDQKDSIIHLGDCPDLGPILFAVAAAKKGAHFTGTRRLRIKESDRAEAMREELKKMGVNVEIGDDFVKVDPVRFHKPEEPLYGHNDHRIVMSLAVLLTITGGEIYGVEAVRKSMPDFFDKMTELGAKVGLYD